MGCSTARPRINRAMPARIWNPAFLSLEPDVAGRGHEQHQRERVQAVHPPVRLACCITRRCHAGASSPRYRPTAATTAPFPSTWPDHRRRAFQAGGIGLPRTASGRRGAGGGGRARRGGAGQARRPPACGRRSTTAAAARRTAAQAASRRAPRRTATCGGGSDGGERFRRRLPAHDFAAASTRALGMAVSAVRRRGPPSEQTARSPSSPARRGAAPSIADRAGARAVATTPTRGVTYAIRRVPASFEPTAPHTTPVNSAETPSSPSNAPTTRPGERPRLAAPLRRWSSR